MSSDEERAAKDSKHLCSSLTTQEYPKVPKKKMSCFALCAPHSLPKEKVSCLTLCAPHSLPKNK